MLNFLGAGCYQHHVPAICDEVNQRGEFLTDYAGEPYDDLGRFQSLFEYCSMMGELLEMDVVSVPNYDGFQATATALRMACRMTGRKRVLLAGFLGRDKLSRVHDYLKPAIEIVLVDHEPKTGGMDLDEEAFRAGHLSPRLVGTLKVPYLQRYMQGVKAPSPLRESGVLEAIAKELRERMKPDWLVIFGPGSTTQAVAAHQGLEKTLLGEDAALDGKIAATDASETDLLRLLSDGRPAEIIVTPIGGQGCIVGRGNQPISPEVILQVGRAHLHVISTPEKHQALKGHPLWIDTGDRAVGEMLSGFPANRRIQACYTYPGKPDYRDQMIMEKTWHYQLDKLHQISPCRAISTLR